MKKFFSIRFLLIAFFCILAFSFFASPVNAENCEDPDDIIGNCWNHDEWCYNINDHGICDDFGNKNYECISYATLISINGNIFPGIPTRPFCRAIWDCSCEDPGSKSQINCETLPYRGTTNRQNFSCEGDNVCVPSLEQITDTSDIIPRMSYEKHDEELLKNVWCVPPDSRTARLARAGAPGSFQSANGPCAPGARVDGRCTSVLTAFGKIGVEPAEFISSLFGILLAASGTIALILFMRAGYQIMSARGNPEGIKEGREKLVAAILGLMFIIFSFVILEVIGVDLLRLPNAI